MRRQLFLEDYDIPSFHINVQGSQSGTKRHYGFNTQFQTKQMKIQTNIRSSQTQSIGFQISPSIISQDLNNKITQNKKQNQQIDPPEETQQSQKKLQKFLRKTIPLMQKQLNQNLPLYSRYGTEGDKKYFKKQSRLVHTLENLDNPSEQKLIVSDVSWNSTGVIVAAGYSACDHDSTCSHKSMICYWGIFKRNFKPTKPQIIYTNNCVNCIQFHPKKPSILACGNYIGEVLLYDLSKKDEQLLAKTTIDDYFHRDLITQISWWAFRPPGKSETNFNILSLGTDGKILLWETPNQSLSQDAPVNRVKMLLKYPLKGFLMLRKKQGNVIPVSGLSMSQSRTNKNIFVIGSEGGSILRATLSPINHHINTQGKVLLDIQQSVKFKTTVYPFMLNLLPKNLRQVKTHIQKIGTANKIEQVDSVTTILALKPQIRNLYPNPITYAFEQLSYPISSISSNKYGLFIANGCDGYSRLYSQNVKQNIQSFEQGYQWSWIDNGSKIGGFIGQQFVVVDWITSNIIWSVAVGQAFKWKQSSSSNSIAVICQQTKVKIIQLGDKATSQPQNARQLVMQKITELTQQ